MSRGGFVHGKKGMSPLIATILLMAFAVALGGMIMNWSFDISVNGECENIDVTINQFCIQNDELFLRGFASEDSAKLVGLKLLVITDTEEVAVNMKNSAVEPGTDISLKVPFSYSDEARVELIGKVGSEGDPFTCSSNPIERVDPISEC